MMQAATVYLTLRARVDYLPQLLHHHRHPMRVFRGTPRRSERAPCALTIGNFDGVHRGHQTLLAHLVRAANPPAAAAVMTFEPHPREVFAPEACPARVSNLRDKLDASAPACASALCDALQAQLRSSRPRPSLSRFY